MPAQSSGVHFWQEAIRVASPGAHLLAFGGTRTVHRLACALEDAGWEIRDTVMWVYSSGFPKSHDVSKAIDKVSGAEREVIGIKSYPTQPNGRSGLHQGYQPGNMKGTEVNNYITLPATEAARQWDGWGTALKPAWEPIIVARKPLEGTVAANVLKWGTGALNIDKCRIQTPIFDSERRTSKPGGGKGGIFMPDGDAPAGERHHSLGRWPANVIHDGSDEVVGLFPVTTTNSIGKALEKQQFAKPAPSGYGGYRDYVYKIARRAAA